MPQQFENPANIEVHARTTAQEVLADFADTPIDVVITGVGTGGHLTACAEVLKASWPGMKAYAVEPTLSPVISGGQPGPHPIQGIGAGSFPATSTPGRSTGRSRSTRRRQGNGAPMRAAGGAAGGDFLRARRWRRSPRSCPSWMRVRGCSGSITIPANAIFRCRISCRSSL